MGVSQIILDEPTSLDDSGSYEVSVPCSSLDNDYVKCTGDQTYKRKSYWIKGYNYVIYDNKKTYCADSC